jgi:competence ComEA-like helix-hairpin-helix protein
MPWRAPSLRVGFWVCLIFFLLCTAAATKKKPPAKPVNINTATSEELQQVPGIGPATAGKILQMRKSYGAFKSVDDLLAIRGLGQKRLDKMRKYLTVGKIPESKSKVAPKSDAGTKSPVQQPPLAKAAIAGHISAHLRLRSFSDAHRVASG